MGIQPIPRTKAEDPAPPGSKARGRGAGAWRSRVPKGPQTTGEAQSNIPAPGTAPIKSALESTAQLPQAQTKITIYCSSPSFSHLPLLAKFHYLSAENIYGAGISPGTGITSGNASPEANPWIRTVPGAGGAQAAAGAPTSCLCRGAGEQDPDAAARVSNTQQALVMLNGFFCALPGFCIR